MYIIFLIVSVAIFLLILSLFRGGKKPTSPDIFLKNLGYNYKLIDEKKIAIPKNFGENMQKYNDLQKHQGFDLKNYAGKVCVQKKYEITGNRKGKVFNKYNDGYIANLIVFDGLVVGGDLHDQLYGSEPKKLDSLKK